MQTLRESVIEKIWDILISGPIIASLVTYFILPLFKPENMTILKAFEITMLYTGVSFLRSLIWRRFFNKVQLGGKKCLR